MFSHIKAESLREGAYLLRRLGYWDEARQFALGRESDLVRCNSTLNKKIDNDLLANGDATVLRRAARYKEIYQERLIHESQITWLVNDEDACVYFWLYMFKNHTYSEEIISVSEQIIPRPRFRPHRAGKRRDDKYFMMQRTDLPVTSPFNSRECLTAALSLMDLSPYSLDERNDILDRIKRGYERIKSEVKNDFSWMSGVDPRHIAWIWTQFENQEDLSEDFRCIALGPDSLCRSIPFIYYFWSARSDTKELFLTKLRKRFANMKHREKVADKKPINIRVSKATKDNLERLVKRHNLNSADVIEFLINKAWDDLNRKN